MICSLTLSCKVKNSWRRETSETVDVCDLLKDNIFETITTKILRKKAKETTKEKQYLQEWESVEQTLWNSY